LEIGEMTVNALKIRLGAPDYMVLYQGTATQIDLGASIGGALLTYTPTDFAIEIDQALSAVASYRTKEEVTFGVALAQTSANLLMAAFNYAPTSIVTVAAGTLVAPPAPTVTTAGTAGVASVTYELVAYNYNGDSVPGPTAIIATANATQSASNYNIINTNGAAVAGAIGYRVIRTVGGATQGLIGTIPANQTTFNDTGIVATTYVAAVAAPVSPSQDTATFGGTVTLLNGTFDWTVPKNDGTNNHWIGHLHKVYSGKAIAIDYKRDKNTELSKVELIALADMTQPVGQQLGWLREQY